MKKLSAVLALCICALALIMTGCGGPFCLKLGFDPNFPPYGYTEDDGSYTGFDIELAQKVCEMEGWRLELKPINWDERDTLLNSGEINCIWNGFTINGREDEYSFTIPYCLNKLYITVGTDSGINSVDDLHNKVVGVEAATSISEYLLEDPEGIKLANGFGLLAQFSNFSTAYTALMEDSLDAVIGDAGITEYYVAMSGGTLRTLEDALLEEQYAVAFKKGSTQLCDTVTADLRALAADGTIARLAEKYGIADAICIE